VIYSFTIEGKPHGKGRPKFWNGHAVTPPETRAAEQEIQWVAIAAGCRPSENAIRMTLDAFYPIAKSWTAKEKQDALAGRSWPKKPDLDNVVKLYGDALNKIAYKDDTQVVSIIANKYFGEPRVEVTIEELSGG
jgi:Holliday junction resolvase RusA-like endonuclease